MEKETKERMKTRKLEDLAPRLSSASPADAVPDVAGVPPRQRVAERSPLNPHARGRSPSVGVG